MRIDFPRIVPTGLGIWIVLSVAGLDLAAMAAWGQAQTKPDEKPAVSEKAQRPAAPKPHWQPIDGKVKKQLRLRNAGRAADRLARKKPTADPAELMRRLNIFVRANRTREAAEMLDRLAASGILVPVPAAGEKPPGSASYYTETQLRDIANFLVRQKQWDLARRFFEVFPRAETVAPLSFVEQWLERGGDPDEIERWLIARAETDPGKWTWVRVRFRRQMGTAGPLIEELAADVRAHPSDAARAKQYAGYVHTAGFRNDAFEARVRWMGEICKPRLAFESFELGRTLATEAPGAAAPLFERSLATDFSDRDRELVRGSSYVVPNYHFLSDRDRERTFRERTMRELANCYQRTGRSDKAQRLVERLVRSETTRLPSVETARFAGSAEQRIVIVEGNGLPSNELARFAGSVEAGSGGRAIERFILDAEDANATSGMYWLTRADYFAGRDERTEALDAYARAMELTPYKRRESPSTTGRRDRIRRRYVRFLSNTSGARDAMELLWRDFYSAPPGSHNTRCVMSQMARAQSSTSTALLKISDPRLWIYLAAQRKHGYTERRVFRHMLENCREFWRVTVWVPAEKAWWEADHARARVVSFVRDFAAWIWREPRELGRRLYAGVCMPFIGKQIPRDKSDLSERR